MVVVLAVAGGIYVGVQAFRPVPAPRLVRAIPSSLVIPGRRPALPWPASGESAVGVPGLGTLGPVGGSKPVPIGSVAKIMTAYVVLHDHPLASPAAQGPSIAVTPADVALYQRDLAQGDSVAAVAAGEHLTERQALEALLIPSGDNIADLLAKWDAGSLPAFLRKMNAAAARLGMRHTHYADASGLSPRTVSTPSDQLILAPRAMAIPAFARIVGKSQVILPVAGLVTNYNTLLGKDGIVGIKTGSTPAAAGCFVFLARRRIGGRSLDIYGTLLGVSPGPGQGLITAALQASQRLLAGVVATIKPVTVLPAGARVARVVSAWGGSAPARTTAPVALVGWPGLHVHISVRRYGPALLPSVPPDAEVGQVQVSLGSQRAGDLLRTARGFPSPGLGWRLGRL
jgi:D-alanyl-D-alanine carboxypeptidase (penicillin-binding protein 5/6)